jgi:hypothetical protein
MRDGDGDGDDGGGGDGARALSARDRTPFSLSLERERPRAGSGARAPPLTRPHESPLTSSSLPSLENNHTQKKNTTTTHKNSDLRANSQPRKRYSRHFAFKGRGRKRHGAIKSRNERVSTRPGRRIK